MTPASTSAQVLRLARGELGYDGVIVTDCLEMGAVQRRMTSGEAVVRAIAAGADLAIVSHQADRQQEAMNALIAAARNGDLPMERLLEANRRLDALRNRVVRPSAPWPDSGPALACTIAQRAVTLVRDDASILPLRAESVGVVTFEAGRSSQVEDTGFRSMLGTTARRRVRNVVEVDGRAGADVTIQQLQDVDTVLVGTARAFEDPRQTETVRALLQSGKHVILIALRDPFDLTVFPEADCYVAAYGGGELEMDATVAVLSGEAQLTGRLPVTLPGLYPCGHGLRSTAR
jgi:beta-N-acetylhexosaminidase